MLVVKRKMITIKQPSKGGNVRQRPHGFIQLSENNNLKNAIKNVSKLTYITAQLGCRLRKAQMPKVIALQPSRVDTSN